MVDLASLVKDQVGDRFLRPEGEPMPPALGTLGIDLMVRNIRATLERFGVHYDHWYSEKSLYDPEGPYDKPQILREKGMLVEREGALWFASSELGVDRNNVVVRSDHRPTYYASDIAYTGQVHPRGFDLVIDVWGADTTAMSRG